MSNLKLALQPVDASFVLKHRIYDALRTAITSVNIYAVPGSHRLDERQLSEDLGVSRTPVREALVRLEQDGLVRTVPRKGAFIVRKTKPEILEMITVWAALEGMAARLITLEASDEEIGSLRKLFATFQGSRAQADIDEYSETNIAFHQTLLKMSRCELIRKLTDNLFVHMRSIRMQTISEDDRASRSIIDHMHIIEALETRDPDAAEQLVREHTLNLGAHVEKNVRWLE